MPTDVDRRHAGRARSRPQRRRGRCASAACRTRAPTGGVRPSRSRWTEPLDATRPGAAPPQAVGGLDLVPGMIPARQSEHCLTAEIWTPALDGTPSRCSCGCPAAATGSAARRSPRTTARRLAAQSTSWSSGSTTGSARSAGSRADGVPSNLGLRDLRPRSTWVRERRAAFGGDPDRIVLMGESAGAGVHRAPARRPSRPTHVPVAGAILQSGAPAGTLDAPTRGVGRRAVPRRRRASTASTTLRDAAARRAPRRAGADGRPPRSARSA